MPSSNSPVAAQASTPSKSPRNSLSSPHFKPRAAIFEELDGVLDHDQAKKAERLPVLVTRVSGDLVKELGYNLVPLCTANEGDRTVYRFLEFLAAQIRNQNTRKVYYRNALHFFSWVDYRGLTIQGVTSMHVAAYIEEISHDLSRPSVKQHLASIRMLFDYLVVGQIVPINPAVAVRGPKHVVKKGKTPGLSDLPKKVPLF